MNYNPNKQRRIDMITAGAYDGRYRQRMVKDKKKENNKRAARKKSNYEIKKFISTNLY